MFLRGAVPLGLCAPPSDLPRLPIWFLEISKADFLAISIGRFIPAYPPPPDELVYLC